MLLSYVPLWMLSPVMCNMVEILPSPLDGGAGYSNILGQVCFIGA